METRDSCGLESFRSGNAVKAQLSSLKRPFFSAPIIEIFQKLIRFFNILSHFLLLLYGGLHEMFNTLVLLSESGLKSDMGCPRSKRKVFITHEVMSGLVGYGV